MSTRNRPGELVVRYVRRRPHHSCGDPYRIRVSARGRDAGRHGELEDDGVDHYRIDFWPAPTQPDDIVRSSSDDAQYWPDTVGSRR